MPKTKDFIILNKNNKLYWNDDLGWVEDISKATLYILKPKSLLKDLREQNYLPECKLKGDLVKK